MENRSQNGRLTEKTVKEKKQVKRKKSEILQIRISPDELNTIAFQAAKCGISNAEYMRRLASGASLSESRINNLAIKDLCRVIGDLGRVGGLLKLWLSMKRGEYSKDSLIDLKSIDAIWSDLQKTYAEVKEKVKSL